MALLHSKRAATLQDRNVFALMFVWATLSSSLLAQTIVVDANEIMKQSLDAGDRNATRLRSYVSQSRVVERAVEPDGSVRSEVAKGYQTLLVDGVFVRKLVAKDDRPLVGDEARKEEARVRKIAAERKSESPSVKRKRVEEQEKKREKARQFNQEILEAFFFKTIGEELLNGRKNWVIEATPRPGFESRDMRAKIFPHLKGKIWIDQQDKLWTKADAVGIDSFTLGFGIIAKLEQGAHLYFQQTRLDDGTWVLRQTGMRAIAHVAMVKRIAIDQVSTFHDYQKVPAGVEVDESTGN